MDCYKKCPLKKRPIYYEPEIEPEPENLSTKPEDLSIKRKATDDVAVQPKRFRESPERENYNNPLTWGSSFKGSEFADRSLSPSTDSCTSADYYRETSLSPPAIPTNYQPIHLRGLNRQEQIQADYLIQNKHCTPYWSVPAQLPLPAAPAPIEPQDLSMKSCIPLPALYHNFAETKPAYQEKSKTLPRFSCHECGKSYSTFAGLSKHQQFHCPAAECNQVKRFFNCDHCEKSYTTSGALKMHIRTHTLPCKCPTCGKAFSRPWLLQGHIRTHTGEKPFTCQYCSRAFADRSNLRAHLQTHAEIKKYICSSCNKSFSRMSLLTKHTEGGCLPQHHHTFAV